MDKLIESSGANENDFELGMIRSRRGQVLGLLVENELFEEPGDSMGWVS